MDKNLTLEHSSDLKFNIGGLSLKINNLSPYNFILREAYGQFLNSDFGKEKISVTICIHPLSKIYPCKQIFQTSNWLLASEKKGDFLFTNTITPFFAKIRKDLSEVKIFLSPQIKISDFIFLEYPLLELIFIWYLSKNKGCLFHACGIELNKCGFLFLGNSEEGKSTLGNLFQPQGVILNDDRVIVKKMKNEFYMFGTPWHSTPDRVVNKKVKLDYIFLLKKSKRNKVSQCLRAIALNALITRSFLPFWDRKGLTQVLDLFLEISQNTPIFWLEFKNDSSITDFLSNFISNEI